MKYRRIRYLIRLVWRRQNTPTGVLWARYSVFLCILLSSFKVCAQVPPAEMPDSADNIIGLYAASQHITKPLYASIKTNLLYDALAVPNVGAEIYLGKGFSIDTQWMYAWWSRESRHRMWRIYGGELRARYWFGSAAKTKPLSGHHAGLYAGIMTFCFEFGSKGYMGGRPGHSLWDRAWINAGVEYGYSLPVHSRFNIDFTIGIGYLGGILEKFTSEDDRHVWKSTVRQTWIGPTKAEITLVWLLGRGNRNIRHSSSESPKEAVSKSYGL
ncbi:MAG: DUF3575 domain-containing protein [Bacteroides sp.]|nr:DUF3575 domain-containing protein [Bacteroides sp.]